MRQSTRPYFLFLLFCCFSAALFAQNTADTPFTGCATDQMYEQHPEFHDAQQRNDQAAYRAALKGADAQRAAHALRTLPVVVHIIHNGGPENISDARIQQGIAQLNAAFNGTFGTGVNTDLQFCLAQRDPQGQATTGITRDQSPLTSFNMDVEDLQVKNLNRWQPTCYINIWVVAAINSSSSGNGVVGYAYFPSAHGSAVDGIVMEAAYFGPSQANTGVLVHEMGHYFGLYHTFQSGCPNANCLLSGDRVCDTPPDQTTFSSCNPNANSCNTDADDLSANNPFTTDVPDLGEDYMDYSTLSCFSKFTPGQSERMNWHVTNVRSSLMGCLSCQTPCPAPLTAAITAPSGALTVTIGSAVNLSATAVNASTVAWNIGSDPAFSTALNPSYTFTTTGVFWVKFRAGSSDPTHCAEVTDSVQVTVECNAQAVLSVPPTVLNGIAATFTNSSPNATTFQWFIDNAVVGTAANLTYIFPTVGSYEICLRVTGTNCDDRFCTFVNVQQNGGPMEGCDNTFIKSLSNMGGTLPGIFAHHNGDFFATGLRNDSTVIVRFNQGGVAQWARAFRFGSDVFQIRDLFVDASGDLIGVAQLEPPTASNLTSTAFRYNLTTNSFTWVQRLEGTLYTQIHALDANNCVLTGVTNNSGNTKTQLIRLNKNTGTISGYNLEGESGDYFSTLHNGILYGACRRYFNSNGDFRASVFAHDAATGAFQWQNSIISRGDANGGPTQTRMYPEKPIVDNEELVVVAAGDLVGFGGYTFGPSEIVVAKTSLTGDVKWTTQYLIAGYNRPGAAAIVATATGYYVVGNLYSSVLGNFERGFIIKINKQGNPVWGRLLGISGKNIVRNVMERSGYLYLTMSSDSYAPNDLLLVKLDQQGNTSTACGFVQPVGIEGISLPKVQNVRNYGVINSGPSPSARNALARTTGQATNTYCNTPCACREMHVEAGPDTSICKGESVVLQAASGFETYTWSPAATLDNPGIQNPTATPAVTTTYTVNTEKQGVELIMNGDFSQGNTGFTSQYAANTTGFGTYNVTTNPTLFNNQWKIASDHSPSADNLMMMIDGSTSSNLPTIWQQTVQVQPNTDYRLSLWGAMAFPSSPPRIEVRFNTVSQTVFSLQGGNAVVGVWQPFDLNFNSGTNTQLDIVLKDLNTASGGNDFAFDDISLRSICHYTDSVTVTVRTATNQTVDLGPDISACVNAVHTFDAGAGFATYLWQDGSTDPTFTAFGPGTYWVAVQDSCNGIHRDTVMVTLAPTPTLDLGADRTICAGESVQLAFTSNGAFTTYNWSPVTGLSCTACPNPSASPSKTTTYYLATSTADGCTNLDSVTILVNQHTAFTQNIVRCIGEPFIFNGNTYTTNGTYVDTLMAANGCDSVVTTVLTFVPLPTRSQSVSFCMGGYVNIGGHTYTQAGTVVDTLPGTAGCDTVVTYTLSVHPLPTRSQSISFCAGESVSIGGQSYTQAGTVMDTLAGTIGCDTVVTYTLQYLTPAPSVVAVSCPSAINIAVQPGGGPTIVQYNLPTVNTDCPCPGVALALTAGLPSGSAFPPGLTQVCYTARDSCGHSASCCFQVMIREAQACDIKEIGCLKYELLTITADAGQNYTYRIRVTNKCANKLIYTAIQIPDGVTAVKPVNLSTFEAESTRKYDVRSPNFTPFYSIRFKSTTDSIANGQSEVFKYTLPAQSDPDYILITSRLVTDEFYAAHLNTFNCPIGVTPSGNKPAERTSLIATTRSELRVFPNPSAGAVFADLTAWSGETVQIRVFNAMGQQVQVISTVAGETPCLIQMPTDIADGLYSIALVTSKGERQTARFVLEN